MTARKADIALNSRVTAFVSRESGAAELQISASTWDEMEKCGQLPKPYLIGPNRDIKRWLWAEVVQRILGAEAIGDDLQAREPYFRGLASGTTKERKRETAT
jgi:predicted DNA-binding transcriptional regulator AlpA